jgi:hypothetical protein
LYSETGPWPNVGQIQHVMLMTSLMLDTLLKTSAHDGKAIQPKARKQHRRPPQRSVHSTGPIGPVLLVTLAAALGLALRHGLEFALLMPRGYSPDPSGHAAHVVASWKAMRLSQGWSVPDEETTYARTNACSGANPNHITLNQTPTLTITLSFYY